MNCTETQNLLHGYIDGELDLVRNLDIEQHLQTCSFCSQAYNKQQELQNALHAGSLYFKAPAHLQQRIQSSVQKASQATPVLRLMPRNATRWLSVAAALVLVVLTTWGLMHVLSVPSANDLLTQEVLSSHVRSLQQANHLVDVPSSDQHTVKPWFDGKLDFSPPVVDLAPQGFPLVGGRLDYLDNRAVAALVYRHRQHIINLFIWPTTASSDQGTTMMTRQGYHIFHWLKAGMTYWAVSDLDVSELQQFVQLVQNQVVN